MGLPALVRDRPINSAYMDPTLCWPFVQRRPKRRPPNLSVWVVGRSVYQFLLRNLTERFPAFVHRRVLLAPLPSVSRAGRRRDVQAMIRRSDTDLILVGISTPKQDLWMHAHRPSFPGVVMIGVGAAFDFHAGRVKQAPAWMQNAGLEWIFRLLMEPSRLWKRYLLVTPWFLPL